MRPKINNVEAETVAKPWAEVMVKAKAVAEPVAWVEAKAMVEVEAETVAKPVAKVVAKFCHERDN